MNNGKYILNRVFTVWKSLDILTNYEANNNHTIVMKIK